MRQRHESGLGVLLYVLLFKLSQFVFVDTPHKIELFARFRFRIC